ncbi:MAG: tetratricopeptide repeat protein, partial [Thiohalocapsa sp.]
PTVATYALMPQTPPSPGEPVAARNPAAAGRRGPAAWRNVAWVGFSDPSAVAEPPLRPDAAPDPVHLPDAPSEGSFAGALPAPAGIAAPPTGAAERKPSRPATVPLFGRVGRRARLLSSKLRQLLRLAAAAATMGAVAVFAYQGGERLAGLTGAPAPAAPVRPTIALAAEESERQPPPPADTSAEEPAEKPAGNPSGTPSEQAAYYRQRAKEGDPAAQFNLAILYSTGSGVAQDFAAAADWLRQAAKAGNAVAQFDLAVLYEEGRGVAPDPAAAASWYRRAAEQNYAPAQYNLAIAQAAGHGVPQDMAAAAGWYRNAAMQGLTAAMINLAILYETGEGVAASLPDAYAWYRAAARGGDQEAEGRARELFAPLPGPEKAKAVMAAAALAAIEQSGAAAKAPMAATPAAAAPRRNDNRSVLMPKRPVNQPSG